MRLIPIFAVLSLAFGVAGSTKAAFSAGAQETVLRPTTAWRGGKFNIDLRGVVSRSNIIPQRPNLEREESMPLGNGRLGLGVWSQECFTGQLNRQDTLPKRLSPGQLVIPVCKLANAADFTGRLDLYDGDFPRLTARLVVSGRTNPIMQFERLWETRIFENQAALVFPAHLRQAVLRHRKPMR
jgi:alpha-L-fucosidase 2